MENRKDIHWPWAPVIIGSGLILLSIVMRMYGFDTSFVNLMSSAGDIVVIFSLLYIIKVFLIDETPLPHAAAMPLNVSMTEQVMRMQASEVRRTIPDDTQTFRINRSAQLPAFWNEMRFRVVAVDERTALITVQADLSATDLPLPAPRAMLELMKHQGEVKTFIQGWAESQHGAGYAVADIHDLRIDQTNDGGLRVTSSYTLASPTA